MCIHRKSPVYVYVEVRGPMSSFTILTFDPDSLNLELIDSPILADQKTSMISFDLSQHSSHRDIHCFPLYMGLDEHRHSYTASTHHHHPQYRSHPLLVILMIILVAVKHEIVFLETFPDNLILLLPCFDNLCSRTCFLLLTIFWLSTQAFSQ